MVVSRRSGLTDHRALPASAGASCTGATRPLVEQPTIAARADHRPRSVLPIDPSRARRGRMRKIRRRSLWRLRESRSVTTRPSRRRGRKLSSSCLWGIPRNSRRWRRRSGSPRNWRVRRQQSYAGSWSTRRRKPVAIATSSRASGAILIATQSWGGNPRLRSSTTWPAASSSICVRCRADLRASRPCRLLGGGRVTGEAAFDRGQRGIGA